VGPSRRTRGYPHPVAWQIEYYEQPDGSAPAVELLDECPTKIDAQFNAVLDAVAAAPPPQFSGGGKWEAMHGSMGGYYEIRLTGPGREQFRLFCLLANAEPAELPRRGLKGPSIVVINGMRKPHRTTFTDRDYRKCACGIRPARLR
jgi:hypothetical protein